MKILKRDKALSRLSFYEGVGLNSRLKAVIDSYIHFIMLQDLRTVILSYVQPRSTADMTRDFIEFYNRGSTPLTMFMRVIRPKSLPFQYTLASGIMTELYEDPLDETEIQNCEKATKWLQWARLD